MSRSVFIAGRSRKALRHPWQRFIILALLLFTVGSRTDAHETIDIDKVNDTVAANDEATARVSAAHDPGPKGEAQFALGMVLVEVTDVLNRDLAAHSGRLTVNAELLVKALAQRNTAHASTTPSGGIACQEPHSRMRCASHPRRRTRRTRVSRSLRRASTRVSCSIPSSSLA